MAIPGFWGPLPKITKHTLAKTYSKAVSRRAGHRAHDYPCKTRQTQIRKTTDTARPVCRWPHAPKQTGTRLLRNIGEKRLIQPQGRRAARS